MPTDLIAFERPTIPQPWPDAEVERLFRLSQVVGMSWSEITDAMGRTESGVNPNSNTSVPFVREPVPAEVLVDHARRLCAGARDLAGAFLGIRRGALAALWIDGPPSVGID